MEKVIKYFFDKKKEPFQNFLDEKHDEKKLEEHVEGIYHPDRIIQDIK